MGRHAFSFSPEANMLALQTRRVLATFAGEDDNLAR